MVDHLHDPPLVDDWFYFLLLRQLVLLHDLHRVQPSRIFFPNKDNPAESAPSDNFYLLEIVSRHLVALLFGVLGKCQLRKVSSEELSVSDGADRSVVLSEPEVQGLAHVEGL